MAAVFKISEAGLGLSQLLLSYPHDIHTHLTVEHTTPNQVTVFTTFLSFGLLIAVHFVFSVCFCSLSFALNPHFRVQIFFTSVTLHYLFLLLYSSVV